MKRRIKALTLAVADLNHTLAIIGPIGAAHLLSFDQGSTKPGRPITHPVRLLCGPALGVQASDRFVTTITWVDGELWHGTWEGDERDVRGGSILEREALERREMPPGVGVSGFESDSGDRFFCGGGRSGRVRAVRRPRGSAAGRGSETPVDPTRKSWRD